MCLLWLFTLVDLLSRAKRPKWSEKLAFPLQISLVSFPAGFGQCFVPSQGRERSVKVCGNIIRLCTRSVAQLCPTLCDPMNYSPPGSSVHGISQARILECVAISSSRGSSRLRDRTHDSYTGREILYQWATREAHSLLPLCYFCLFVSFLDWLDVVF